MSEAALKITRWTGPDLIWVRWWDAAFSPHAGGTHDEPVLTDSFGMLVEETRKFIRIAQTGYPPEYNWEDCAERLVIPKKMIEFARVVRSFKGLT